MKPNYNNGAVHTGNFEGQVFKLTLDASSVPHLMTVLTDVYSQPAKAVIREYATNARDAHVAKGNLGTTPVEVTLPNGMNPTLIIRDFGIGMSPSTLTEVYTSYGASTKRSSDTEAGMLGLGCKSALTYTSQFTIVTVHGGVQTTAVMSRGEDGAGSLRVIDTSATEAPTGTTITIPVKDPDEMKKAAIEVLRFWEDGTVLVDGKVPSALREDLNLQFIADDVALSSSLTENYVVMGGVAYPVRGHGRVQLDAKVTGRVVLYVPMGAINFTPSREELQYTELTNETLALGAAYVGETVQRVAQEMIDSAPTAAEAVRKYTEVRSVFIGAPNTWRGTKVPLNHGVDVGKYESGKFSKADTTVSASRFYPLAWEEKNTHGYGYRQSVALHIVNFPLKTFASSHREKLALLVRSGGTNFSSDRIPTVYVWSGELPGGQFTSQAEAVEWETVKAVKLPKAERSVVKRDPSEPAPKKEEPTYTVPAATLGIEEERFDVVTETEVSDYLTRTPEATLYYISPADDDGNQSGRARNTLELVGKGDILLTEGRNRWDRMERVFGEDRCEEWTRDVAEEVVKAALKGRFTEDDIRCANLVASVEAGLRHTRYYHRSTPPTVGKDVSNEVSTLLTVCSEVKPERLDDKELAAFLREAKARLERGREVAQEFYSIRDGRWHGSRWYEVTEAAREAVAHHEDGKVTRPYYTSVIDKSRATTWLRRYPLLGARQTDSIESLPTPVGAVVDFHEYVNAAHLYHQMKKGVSATDTNTTQETEVSA